MNANEIVISIIRTITPMAVGALAGWLLVHHILTVSASEQSGVTALVASALAAGYYAGIRLLEAKFPKLPWGILLGFPSAPSYKAKTP